MIEAVQREANSWQRGMSSDSQFSAPHAATLSLCLGWQSCLGPAASPETAMVATEGAQGLSIGGVAAECALGGGTEGALTHCIPGMCYSLRVSQLCSLGYLQPPPRPDLTLLHPFLHHERDSEDSLPPYLQKHLSGQETFSSPGKGAQKPSCTWHQLRQAFPHGCCGGGG